MTIWYEIAVDLHEELIHVISSEFDAKVCDEEDLALPELKASIEIKLLGTKTEFGVPLILIDFWSDCGSVDPWGIAAIRPKSFQYSDPNFKEQIVQQVKTVLAEYINKYGPK